MTNQTQKNFCGDFAVHERRFFFIPQIKKERRKKYEERERSRVL